MNIPQLIKQVAKIGVSLSFEATRNGQAIITIIDPGSGATNLLSYSLPDLETLEENDLILEINRAISQLGLPPINPTSLAVMPGQILAPLAASANNAGTWVEGTAEGTIYLLNTQQNLCISPYLNDSDSFAIRVGFGILDAAPPVLWGLSYMDVAAILEKNGTVITGYNSESRAKAVQAMPINKVETPKK